MRREIILLTENHRKATSGGIPCNTGTIDAAADDQNIAIKSVRRLPHRWPTTRNSNEAILLDIRL
jgi:hypothetical protein